MPLSRSFSVNDPILFVLAGIVIAFVLIQSFVFLFKAIKQSKKTTLKRETIKKTIISSAIFTIAPAVAILVGVITLSRSLGIAIPWLRLSIVGSLSYETVAAANAINALGLDMATQVTDASAFVTIVFVMTLGIMSGLIIVPTFTKKIYDGVLTIKQKDHRWGEIFNEAMFLGMISAFIGFVFCDVSTIFKGDTSGLIPVCVMLVSSVVMAILGILSKKTHKRWITDYALPISLIAGMASAIPFTNWLG